jgi:adenosylmethionine-8-amino-7-oxononanoate aminotransferase
MLPQKTISARPPLIVDRGDGVTVTDVDGKQYLDCQGGLWCVNVGHNRAEVKHAIVAQLDKLQYYTQFPGTTTVPSIELAAKLCDIADVEGMRKVFFSSGGSDAVESAFKISRQFWKIEGRPEKFKIISLRHGYHGLHFGGLSATSGTHLRRSYEPLVPGFVQVESPNVYRNPFTSEPEELARICALLLDREIENQGAHTVAAVIAEPVQGAGGVNVPPASYWPQLRAVCDKHNVLLIADEVVTGLGRTGSLFGCRGWGVKPDVMTMAKGLTSGYIPLGATVLGERVAAAYDKDSAHALFMHGLTYSGHPVACAAAIAVLDLTLREQLTENAREVGAYFLASMQETLAKHEPIGDVRGKGLMLAVELVKDRETKEPYTARDAYPGKITEFCAKAGMIVRGVGGTFIISPPLIFTKKHVDQAVDILDKAFTAERP